MGSPALVRRALLKGKASAPQAGDAATLSRRAGRGREGDDGRGCAAPPMPPSRPPAYRDGRPAARLAGSRHRLIESMPQVGLHVHIQIDISVGYPVLSLTIARVRRRDPRAHRGGQGRMLPRWPVAPRPGVRPAPRPRALGRPAVQASHPACALGRTDGDRACVPKAVLSYPVVPVVTTAPFLPRCPSARKTVP